MTTCLTCAHWEPKPKNPMFKHHMAVCRLGVSYTYFPHTHECKKYTLAAAARIENRRNWLGVPC